MQTATTLPVQPAAQNADAVRTLLVSTHTVTRRVVATPAYAYAKPSSQVAKPLPVKSPDLSPAERLNKEYEKLNAGYWKSAINENARYEIRAYDIDTDTVYLQEGSVKANEVYAINRQALTCTCWQAKGVVARTNAQLVEAGANKRLMCKHICMINLRENALDWVEFELNLATLGQTFKRLGKDAAIAEAVDRAFSGRDELHREAIALSASDEMERLFN